MFRSYDIFDTCIVRSCGDPQEVFDILASRYIPASEVCQLRDFAKERIDGERRARRIYEGSGIEDVTIAQIYDCCDFSNWTSAPKRSILEEELRIEKSILFPVASIRNEISQARTEGNTIAFISDIYLDRSFIQDILVDFGLYFEGDLVFLSSEIKLTKCSGNLYRYISEKFHIGYKQWTHCGDNILSDISIPRSLGIKSIQVKHEYTEYEYLLSQKEYGSSSFYTQRFSSLCKSIRISNVNTPYELFATTFIAPIFVPFVFELLRESERRGIKHLCFLARDAYIFYVIAQQLSRNFPEIKLDYLYVSRKSLYLPGLKTIDYNSISSMFWNFESIKAEDIIERLQIEDYDLSQFSDGNCSSRQVLETLLSDSVFVEKVCDRQRQQKQLLLEYLVGIGLGESDCGIVDLTGTRRCHNSINNILSDAGLKPVFGFYFSVMDSRLYGNDYWAFHFEERYFRNKKNCFLFPHDLFEQYFCATDQLRTASYKKFNGRVEPEFENDSVKQSEVEIIGKSNERICRLFAKSYPLLLSGENGKVLSDKASSVYTYFYNVPKIEYLSVFSGFKFSDSKRICYPLFQDCSFFEAYHQVGHPWRYGLMMVNSRFPRLLYTLFKYKFLHRCKS